MIFARETEPYEVQFIDVVNTVLRCGKKQLNERTGIDTLRIPHAAFSIDLQQEFPILKSKQVYWKSAAKEILWIMQQQSNNIHNLDAHIWDEWADKNGSIGKAYGYQVAKPVIIDGITYPSQVHYVLGKLENDSSDRRAVINLWDVDDLNDMNLVPCCFSSVWNIIDGKLNCLLTQRSSDLLLGVPFNTTQYAILTHLFARHLGVEVGQLTHVMSDVHIYCYDSHLDCAKKIVRNYEKWDAMNLVRSDVALELAKESNTFKKLTDVAYCNPKLEIATPDTDFFEISIDDIRINDYNYMEKINLEVAV